MEAARMYKRNKKKRKAAALSFNLASVELDIKRWLDHPMDDSDDRLELPEYTRQQRLQVHTLCQRFGVVCKSYGDADHRGIVLRRTADSHIPDDDETAHIVGRSKKFGNAKLGDEERRRVMRQGRPIPDSNVGHKLLAKMGWTTGTGLGAASAGIAQPLQFDAKRDRIGLGGARRR